MNQPPEPPTSSASGKQQAGQQPSRFFLRRAIPLASVALLALVAWLAVDSTGPLGQDLIANPLQLLAALPQQQLIHT